MDRPALRVLVKFIKGDDTAVINQTIVSRLVVVGFLAWGLDEWHRGCSLARAGDVAAAARTRTTVRIAAAQPKNRTIDFRLAPAHALAQVDKSLAELEGLVAKAGAAGCDALALPEDTLGLLKWELANRAALKEVLPQAVSRMLDRLGRTAAKHRMYLVVCNDTAEPDGTTHNTAFLLGRDGKEIGRYHKVNLPLGEQSHTRGDRFPVFQTPDLGGVGLLICYDMVFPEAARCLALGGADIIFHPTLGGAAIGDDDISLAAFRTRAVENFVYLVVAMRGSGSMIISPAGPGDRPSERGRRPRHRRHRPGGRARRRRRLQHPARHARPTLPRARPTGLRHPHRPESAGPGQGAVERDPR